MEPLDVVWDSFRGFSKPTRFSFPKISVLIGRNNVGKTSAYTPLLAMRQTLNASDPQTALLSRGSSVDIGPFKDYVSGHDESRAVSFTVNLPRSPSIYVGSRVTNLGGMEVEFEDSPNGNARLRRHRIFDSAGRTLVMRSREQDSDTFTVTSSLLPSSQSVGRPLKEITQLRRGLREEKPRGFLFSGYGGLLMPRSWRQNEERWEKAREWFDGASDIFEVHANANSELVNLLNGISYLGPLRSLPNRTYRLAAERPSDVGREGEHAPEMLFHLGDGPMKERVDHWLNELGYGKLRFQDVGEEYFRLNLETRTGLLVNFAHSGIGLSQLLPLLVQGVAVRPGATFIAQQPEIHLNPAQQCIITDFLIEVSKQGGRVIVETHSEHVLLRLRRRMAEDESLNSDDVGLYYFDNVRNRTVVNRIQVSDRGEIARETWPKGFFDEQLNDSFALAVAQSRSANSA